MKTVIANGIVLTPDERIDGGSVTVEEGRILLVERGRSAAPPTIDARGCFVIPGFIDVHVHGADGFDTMDATPEAIQSMGRFMARHGVTAYLPTTVAASRQDTLASIANVRATPASLDGAEHLGVHLEGPYLNHQYRGAQPPQHLRAADPHEYEQWFESGVIRLITVAPEVDGVQDLVRLGTQRGIEFAVGHTAATYDQTLSAADAGLRQATHVFNGMPALHHREPGPVGAVLADDRIMPQVIADGVHLHPAVVKLLIRAKGIDRTILITDAVRATGMPDGEYALGDQIIHVRQGVARTAAGGLAGSTLTMDGALQNVIRFVGLSLQEALPMLTRVPADSIGCKGRKGRIASGYDADLVLVDDACRVRLTMVRGRVVYQDL